MDLDDLFKPKKSTAAVFGENLATMSIPDLQQRLLLIADEKARVEAEIAAREASRAAAESVFKS
jgi:uncharacterized small protein (DUF1192 family)